MDLNKVLERYNAIRKPCPICGKPMMPMGDSESYLYCWDCKIKCDFEGEEKP